VKEEHIEYLACPSCAGDLLVSSIEKHEKDSIETGRLHCRNCDASYDIIRHIPRFVPLENYSASFGFQWSRHARTQYDSYTGTTVSATRFFGETKWPRHLHGQTILEVGSGSGRFTEQAASTGATVVSMDYSCAVDANYRSNGHKENVLIVQGNIYSMPFRTNLFDKLFCIGVLQHTPNVEKAFLSLPDYLRGGGSLVIDVYRYSLWRRVLLPKYWVRPITARLAPETLYRWCQKYVRVMWRIAVWINRLPKGRHINRALLIPDYRGVYPLSEEMLKEWAVLDMFDALSAAYDKPQSVGSVKRWFEKAGLENVEVRVGYNGIEGRGTKRH